MREPPSPLSRSVEDYLSAIYRLGAPGEVATTSSIAEALDVQPASVTGMVKRLAEAGFLEHVPYRGVRLTGAGIQAALRILRRHRILESYLTQRLGFRWEDVHREAERLEHAASDELVERMAAALGNPRHDPHGAPIPTATGEIEPTDSFTLAGLDPGREGRVRAIRDDDAEGLLRAEAAGLLPGTRVRVLQRGGLPPFLQLQVEGFHPREISIPLSVAERVYVVALPEPDRPADQPG